MKSRMIRKTKQTRRQKNKLIGKTDEVGLCGEVVIELNKSETTTDENYWTKLKETTVKTTTATCG